MPRKKSPRAGSMQFWPRVRAKRQYPRIRSWPKSKDSKLLGFAGYKVGMTHIIVTDNVKTSQTKGEDIVVPVTVVECPPLKIFSIRLYKKNPNLSCVTEIRNKLDKEVSRKVRKSKKEKQMDISNIKPEDYDDIRVCVYTQPRLTGIGKKKPEIFELALGGTNQDKFNFIKENINKEITVNQVFKPGDLVDVKAVTKGKGYQGPVKRFGIAIRPHKSEKTKRGPGTLGPWSGQGHIMYRVAHAGQMGYHTRTTYNKQIYMISNDTSKINPKGGWKNYGLIKNHYVLIKGSVDGPPKRIIRLNHGVRIKKPVVEPPAIQYISLESSQG